jgi:hypothetical protein
VNDQVQAVRAGRCDDVLDHVGRPYRVYRRAGFAVPAVDVFTPHATAVLATVAR